MLNNKDSLNIENDILTRYTEVMSGPMRFALMLDHSLNSGLGRGDDKIQSWSSAEIAVRLDVTVTTVNNWRAGRNFPSRENFAAVLSLLFGDEYTRNKISAELISIYNRFSPFYMWADDGRELEVDVGATQQVPAAYRFGAIEGKLDALPPDAEASDAETAADYYEEFKTKLGLLRSRLARAQADDYVVGSIERLYQSLGGTADTIRPGVLLSRMRTLESIRNAYDSEEGRDATFPDFRSAVDDVWLSGQDLLTLYPVVRQIERTRLALDLERAPDTLDAISVQLNTIRTSAVESEIVSDDAASALGDNLAAITSAKTIDERAELLGDNLLVARNFVSEAIRAIATSSRDGVLGVWDALKDDLEIGAQNAARMLPPLAVIALLTSIAGPIAGIAGLLRGDIFRSVSSAVTKINEAQKSKKK